MIAYYLPHLYQAVLRVENTLYVASVLVKQSEKLSIHTLLSLN